MFVLIILNDNYQYMYMYFNSMNVIIGLCHSYSGKVVTFQESFFACKRKLSKTSRLLRLAATGNCPDRLGWMTARLTTAGIRPARDLQRNSTCQCHT